MLDPKSRKSNSFRFDRLVYVRSTKEILSQKNILQLIDYLISSGYLLAVSGEYPVLKVSESGVAVLMGKELSTKRNPKSSQQLSDDETDGLFEALRQLRTDLASDAGVPPYVVFQIRHSKK